MVAMLHVHPTRAADLLEPDELETNAGVTRDEYVDSFGNRCTRLVVPAGELQLRGSTLIVDSGKPDATGEGAAEHPVAEAPHGDTAVPVGQPLLRGGSAFAGGA